MDEPYTSSGHHEYFICSLGCVVHSDISYFLTHFMPLSFHGYLFIHPKNIRICFFYIFREYWKRPVAWNGLKEIPCLKKETTIGETCSKLPPEWTLQGSPSVYIIKFEQQSENVLNSNEIGRYEVGRQLYSVNAHNVLLCVLIFFIKSYFVKI